MRSRIGRCLSRPAIRWCSTRRASLVSALGRARQRRDGLGASGRPRRAEPSHVLDSGVDHDEAGDVHGNAGLLGSLPDRCMCHRLAELAATARRVQPAVECRIIGQPSCRRRRTRWQRCFAIRLRASGSGYWSARARPAIKWPRGRSPSLPRRSGSLHDAADFATRCGPSSCSTPLRPRPLDLTRGLRYRGPWRLPGPDSHRLAAASLTPGYDMTPPLASRVRAAGRTRIQAQAGAQGGTRFWRGYPLSWPSG